jgi:hypothetical protein
MIKKSSGGGSNAPVQRERLPLPRRAVPEATVTLGTRMLQVCAWSNLQPEQLPLSLPQRRLNLACAENTPSPRPPTFSVVYTQFAYQRLA